VPPLAGGVWGGLGEALFVLMLPDVAGGVIGGFSLLIK